MTRENHRYQGDRRESGKRQVEVQEQTLPSAAHENRNEDASIGDVARLQQELSSPPDIAGDPESQAAIAKRPELSRLVASHLQEMRESGERELAVAEKLKDGKVFGVFDGVSGSKEGVGAGAVASRIASGTIAERMADLPPNATVDQTKKALAEAFQAANTDITDYKKRNKDFTEQLGQMACTADVLKAIDNGDGTHEVVFGHVGDSRIYVMDGESGELKQMTKDDSLLEVLAQQGQLSPEQAAEIAKWPMGELDKLTQKYPDKNPQLLKMALEKRQAIVKAVRGGDDPPTIGSFRVKSGDRVLVTSDGIHDNVPADRIAEIMRAGGGAKELAQEAYAQAGGPGRNKSKDAKGPDDITLQVLEFGGEAKEKATQERTRGDVRPENFDSAVANARMRLEALPSPREVGQEEHDRQKYEVLSEMSEFLTAQLNAEKDPAKRETAASLADELANKGPEKMAVWGLSQMADHDIAQKEGRPAPPIIDMQGMAWLQKFKEAGWTPEQVKDWAAQQRQEIDRKATETLESNPELKRLAEAYTELEKASAELRRLGREMQSRQEAKDRAALDQARVRVSRTPAMMFTPEQTAKMHAEVERQRKEKEEQKGRPIPKKPSIWSKLKFWGKK